MSEDLEALKRRIKDLEEQAKRNEAIRKEHEAALRAAKIDGALVELGISEGASGARIARVALESEKRIRVNDAGEVEVSANGIVFERLTKESIRRTDLAWMFQETRRTGPRPHPGADRSAQWSGEDLARRLYSSAMGITLPD